MHDHRVPVESNEPFPVFLADIRENGRWKRHRWVPVALTKRRVRQALDTTAGTFRSCVGGKTWT